MQHRFRTPLTLGLIFLGLLVAAPGGAASLQQVSDWGASGVPSYVKMYIYVPDQCRRLIFHGAAREPRSTSKQNQETQAD
jgi:hypothetical protein